MDLKVIKVTKEPREDKVLKAMLDLKELKESRVLSVDKVLKAK